MKKSVVAAPRGGPARRRWMVGNAHRTTIRIVPVFFYAGDRDEPPHVHVERDDCEAKVWFDPIRLERSHGFTRKEIHGILRRVENHPRELLERWHGFFRD